ncbi:MAG TPA: hypothetical protein VMB19_15845, partial [Silvibacterium sp.]|nr:hypothetical protein [Silvibacterium sp.]
PISPLNDQIAAGAFMWVFGSMIFLIPVAAVIMQVLSARGTAAGSGPINAEQLTYAQREAV